MKIQCFVFVFFVLLLSSCNNEEAISIQQEDEVQTTTLLEKREHEDGGEYFEMSYEDFLNHPEGEDIIIESGDDEIIIVKGPNFGGTLHDVPFFMDEECSEDDVFLDPDRPSFPFDDGQCRFITKWCGPDQFCNCYAVEMTVSLSYDLNPNNAFWSQTKTLTPGSWAVFDLQSSGNLFTEIKCISGVPSPNCEYKFFVDSYGFNKGGNWYNLRPNQNRPLLTGEFHPYDDNTLDTWWYCNPFCTLQVPYQVAQSCGSSKYLKLMHSQSGFMQSYFYLVNSGFGNGYFAPLEPRANVQYHVETVNMNCSPSDFCYSICYYDNLLGVGICPSADLTYGSFPVIMSTGSSPGICTGYSEVSRNVSCD